MGVLKLMDFIKTKFPKAIQKRTVKDYSGKILTIDASNWIYQFLIKTQTIKGGSVNTPTDWKGNQTGHLIGMLSRIAHCLENNISTVWVFDGKPPEEKYTELKRRRKIKQEAQQKKQEAIDEGQTFDLLKMSKRTITITKQQKESAIKLIQLMGIPLVQSPSEAEPQCAEIVKQGLAYGTVSQDMDTLAFGCPRLLRYFSQQQISQVSLETLLKQSNFTYEQFIDFCILCGCDYTSRIKNIGTVKAYTYLQKYQNIDNILKEIVKDDKMFKRHTFEDDFNHYAARKIFIKPQVKKLTEKDLKKGEFKQNELVQFLKQKQFSENRINNWLARVKKTDYFSQI